jgi:hypothetical protein
MLVYLTARTWTSGEPSAIFASEVRNAMARGVPLLLCHEMPGVGEQTQRSACPFDRFFSCVEGSTPHELLKLSIYSQIATPLKGGAWRHVSMVMVALALAKPAERTTPIPIGGNASGRSSRSPGGRSPAISFLGGSMREGLARITRRWNSATGPILQTGPILGEHQMEMPPTERPPTDHLSLVPREAPVVVTHDPPVRLTPGTRREASHTALCTARL